jgi:hypothetical protein
VLRAATLRLASQGFQPLSTIHDALLLSVPDTEVEGVAPQIARLMEEAAVQVIGAPIRVDMQIVRAGERLLTTETAAIWEQVMHALDEGDKMRGEQKKG